MNSVSIVVVVLLAIVVEAVVSYNPGTVTIGAIFERATFAEDVLVQTADIINNDGKLLPRTNIEILEQRIDHVNTIEAMQYACDFIEQGAVVIISSTSCSTNRALQALADAMHVPHVMVLTETCPVNINSRFTLSMEANSEVIFGAVVDVVRSQNWDRSVVLYDEDLGCGQGHMGFDMLRGLNAFLYKIKSSESDSTTADMDLTQVLQSLKMLKADFNYVVIASPQNSRTVMDIAGQLNMLTAKFTWVFFSLDMVPETLPTHNVTSDSVNIVKREKPDLNRQNISIALKEKASIFETSNAEIFDAVVLVSEAVNQSLDQIQWPDPGILQCKNLNFTWWISGQKLFNTMRRVDMQGLSGEIFFTDSNYRKQLQLEVFNWNVSATEWMTIGKWNSINKLDLDRAVLNTSPTFDRILQIVTVVEEPFFFTVTNKDGSVANVGFCMDLLDHFAKKMDFVYNISIMTEYGVQDPTTGMWTGVVGEVAYKRADMAVAGMTIKANREEVVDFTVRYMDYGVSILIKKPDSATSSVMAFVKPLGTDVWMAIGISIITVATLLFLITRISPYTRLGDDPEEIEVKQFTIINCMWFTLSSIMQQGGELHPKTVSGRVLGAFWWFFSMIIIATYTANLAAFLTTTKTNIPVNSLSDLLNQDMIKFGTRKGSSVEETFRDLSDSSGLYKSVSEYFQANPDVLPDSFIRGYERVREGNYAFLWDEATHLYESSNNCDLINVGTPFFQKGYGIALQRGAAYRENINDLILGLRESGELEKMRKDWFEVKGMACPSDASSGAPQKAGAINLDNVAGVFYAGTLGTTMAFCTALLEWFFVRKIRKWNQRFGSNFNKSSSGMKCSWPNILLKIASTDPPPQENVFQSNQTRSELYSGQPYPSSYFYAHNTTYTVIEREASV